MEGSDDASEMAGWWNGETVEVPIVGRPRHLRLPRWRIWVGHVPEVVWALIIMLGFVIMLMTFGVMMVLGSYNS